MLPGNDWTKGGNGGNNQISTKHISNEGALAHTTSAKNREGMKSGHLMKHN